VEFRRIPKHSKVSKNMVISEGRGGGLGKKLRVQSTAEKGVRRTVGGFVYHLKGWGSPLPKGNIK